MTGLSTTRLTAEAAGKTLVCASRARCSREVTPVPPRQEPSGDRPAPLAQGATAGTRPATRPGNPFCWVCWNSLSPERRVQLDAAERYGLVEFLGTALAMGREMAESR